MDAMLFCKNCKKEVVIMAIPFGAVRDDELSRMQKEIEKDGKIPLFNPSPFGPYSCPICATELVEK